MDQSADISCVEMTQITLMSHGNALGNLFGGQIAAWIDSAGAVAAQRFSRGIVVTASMDEIHFIEPVRVGMIVTFRARVNRAWKTSMEVGVQVESEDPIIGERRKVCSAYLTFVALDAYGKTREVPNMVFNPQDDNAQEILRRWNEAQLRRDARLKMRELRKAISA